MSNGTEEYYLEDIFFKVRLSSMLIASYSRHLEVEDQLFKVPRHLLVKLSPVFRDMSESPVPEGAKADGLSDDQPLILEGIAKKEFVQLLRCLYPL